ncbi:MAG: ABC transporter ATP-binding protein [Myxococcales bacterium]|nr:ABC transporter ATP-binding protein [Myxococcales bacterium]
MSDVKDGVLDAPVERTPPISNREAARLMLRSFEYLGPLKGQMTVKIGFQILAMLPLIVLPWPTKMLIDHVIQGLAVADLPYSYPFFVAPLAEAILGMSPTGMAIFVGSFLSGMLLLIGAWGMSGRDQTFANVAQGTDEASRSENHANQAFSYMGGILGLIDYRWTLRLTHNLNHHYRSKLFGRMQRLPMTSLDDQRIGDSVYRVMYDTSAITEVCYRLVLTPITAPLHVALVVWVIYLSYGDQPVVIWTALSIVPAALMITFPFSGALRRRMQAARDTGSETTTTIEESINNILAVQSLGGQDREKKRFDDDSWRSFAEWRKLAVLWILMIVLAGLAAAAVGLFVVYELTDKIFTGEMTVGDLTVLMAYYLQIGFSATNAGRLWVYLQGRVIGLRRAFDLMDAEIDHQPEIAKPLKDVREGYVFEDVSFNYPDGTPAMKNVSLEAKRGTLVALAGPAGAGKTTLAYMLPRFITPASGRSTIDGNDIMLLDRQDLRDRIAFVFQEPALFDATVGENIRVGKPDATDEEVQRAAEVAGAAEFIRHLPEGYDTPLGRNGGRLSVGQKQRLSIARALVRDAPVLILDEPTAALDPETEFRLVAALREASKDKLVVVIAHRLSTIRHADQIIFLQEGEIRERGSHEELMQREGGAYRRFVELQRGGGGVR